MEDVAYEIEIDLNTLIAFNNNDVSFIKSKILNELCFKEFVDFINSNYYEVARTFDEKVFLWFIIFGEC
jgi:hypothetical protein